MLFALLSVLLIGHHVQAVVNKATSQVPLTKEEEKPGKAKADDRISNTFAAPSAEYGTPLSFNGPAPVYGPPELAGNLGQTVAYPPLPSAFPPLIFEPPNISDLPLQPLPPWNIKPQYGPPLKQSFASLSTSLLPKPIYGPPKLHYGLPKQHFTPPSASFPSFILSKPQYVPPLKLVGASSQQYIPPSAGASQQHGPPKPGHGPPIPISLETYGTPPAKLAIQFNPLPNDEYGPPPPPAPAPQPQYGPPAGDLYGPPPPAPPPGVPAPPTPPDIKYDGWQPIAGLASSPNQSGPPTDTYGPPIETKHNYAEGSSSSGTHLSHASLSVPTNSNVPSDSYGVPIHNPEAQDLRISVHQSSVSSESNGLPPPPLPQQEPLHNNQGPGVVTSAGHQAGLHQQQQSGLQYSGAPNIEPVSIVKTVGFELLPTTGGVLGADLQSLSLSGGTSDVSSFNHISGSVNANSASLHSGLELTQDDGASHAVAPASDGDSAHGLQNAGVDLSLQLLPQQQTPSSDYGAPFNTFGKFEHPGVSPGAPLLAPPPFDTYGAPPLSSYSPNGPYPAAQSGRGPPAFPPFGLYGGFFHKQNLHHPKIHAPFRPPLAPPGSLIPPRNREPIKFREPIPTGLLTNINRYVPPFTKQKLHGPSLPLGPQLPSHHAPVPFRYASGPGNSFSGSFSSGASHGGYNLNSPIAAPHVQYGTPLSFTDFNTPAPHLTYGAPNFGSPTSYVSTFSGFGKNLYSGIGNALTTTYGTPLVNAPLSIGGGHDCNSLQPLFPSNGAGGGLSASAEAPFSGSLPSSGELHSSGETHLSGGLSSGAGVPLGDEPPPLGGGLLAHGDAHSSGKLQLSFDNAPYSAGQVEAPAPVFSNSLSTGFASSGAFDGGHPSPVFNGDSLGAKPLGDYQGGLSVNSLDLQHNVQQKINLKDSYGNPVGVIYDAANEASDSKIVHATTPDISNELSAHLSSQTHNIYPEATSFQYEPGMSAEAFTASLTAKAFGQAKSLASNEVDPDQFLKSSEGSEALSLAQRLTANGADDFEIQGSKGTYTLQIQPADGGLGTENSDGNIRHEQLLSNGLLQNILAAIEQPENNGLIQLQGPPESQALKKIYDSLPEGTSVKGHFISSPESSGQRELSKQDSVASESEKYSKIQPVALFYDTKYDEAKKEVRSVSKSEAQVAKASEQSESKPSQTS